MEEDNDIFELQNLDSSRIDTTHSGKDSLEEMDIFGTGDFLENSNKEVEKTLNETSQMPEIEDINKILEKNEHFFSKRNSGISVPSYNVHNDPLSSKSMEEPNFFFPPNSIEESNFFLPPNSIIEPNFVPPPPPLHGISQNPIYHPSTRQFFSSRPVVVPYSRKNIRPRNIPRNRAPIKSKFPDITQGINHLDVEKIAGKKFKEYDKTPVLVVGQSKFVEILNQTSKHNISPPVMSLNIRYEGFQVQHQIRDKRTKDYFGEISKGNKDKFYRKRLLPLLDAMGNTNVMEDFIQLKEVKDRFLSSKAVEKIKSNSKSEGAHMMRKEIMVQMEEDALIKQYGTNITKNAMQELNLIGSYTDLEEHTKVGGVKKWKNRLHRIPVCFRKKEFYNTFLKWMDSEKHDLKKVVSFTRIAREFYSWLRNNKSNDFILSVFNEFKNYNTIGYKLKQCYLYYKREKFLLVHKELYLKSFKKFIKENNLNVKEGFNQLEKEGFQKIINMVDNNQKKNLSSNEYLNFLSDFEVQNFNFEQIFRFWLYDNYEIVVPELKFTYKPKLRRSSIGVQFPAPPSVNKTKKTLQQIQLGTEKSSEQYETISEMESLKRFFDNKVPYIGKAIKVKLIHDNKEMIHNAREFDVRLQIQRKFSLLNNKNLLKKQKNYPIPLKMKPVYLFPGKAQDDVLSKINTNFDIWGDAGPLMRRSFHVILIQIVSSSFNSLINDGGDEKVKEIVLEILNMPIEVVMIFAPDDTVTNNYLIGKFKDICTSLELPIQCGDDLILQFDDLKDVKGDISFHGKVLNHNTSGNKRNPYSGVPLHDERIVDYSFLMSFKGIGIKLLSKKYFEEDLEWLKSNGFKESDFKIFEGFESLEHFKKSKLYKACINPDALHTTLGLGKKIYSFLINEDGFEKSMCNYKIGQRFCRPSFKLDSMKNCDIRFLNLQTNELIVPYISFGKENAKEILKRFENLSYASNCDIETWKNLRFHVPIDSFVFFLLSVFRWGKKIANCNYTISLCRDLPSMATLEKDSPKRTLQERSCEEGEKYFAKTAKPAVLLSNNQEENVLYMIPVRGYYRMLKKLKLFRKKNQNQVTKIKKLCGKYVQKNSVIPSCIVKKYKKELSCFFDTYPFYIKYDPDIHSTHRRFLFYHKDEKGNLVFDLGGIENSHDCYSVSPLLLHRPKNVSEIESVSINTQKVLEVSKKVFEETDSTFRIENEIHKKKSSKRKFCKKNKCKNFTSKKCEYGLCSMHCRQIKGCFKCEPHWKGNFKKEEKEKKKFLSLFNTYNKKNYKKMLDLTKSNPKGVKKRGGTKEDKYPKLLEEDIFSFRKRLKLNELNEIREFHNEDEPPIKKRKVELALKK